ncbi:hypothetical protein HHK36_002586 [Tetracentron sinense]|uniref:Glutamate receptor n=1 Tax=Tetracentron sinense TaxID=13715 RepID=A0A834ZMA4_TETSI|nr:hypothetical protein HHK36_002586 [Tetracentron sinense]
MYGVLLPFFMVLLHQSKAIANEGREDQFVGTIGGLVDYSSRVGKEEKTAMQMAAKDFYSSTGSQLLLHLRDSYGDSAPAISTAIDLIDNQRVEAIIGTLRRQEAALVNQIAKTTNNKKVPIISLAAAAIPPTAARSPFVVSMANDLSLQMRCIAAIIGSFRWRKVIAIYQDSDPYTSDSGIVTLLSDSLRVVGAEIEHHSAFPPMSSLLDPTTIIQDELKKLRRKQCRVFIVLQSSLPLAALLFDKAQQLGMMGKGYVWITTDGITSLLDSVNSSVISSMQGVLGVKTYFPDNTTSFRGFKVRFRRKFQSEYPEEEENHNPSIFALRAYDATWSIAKAMEKLGGQNNSTSLLQGILSSDFKGLSGEIQFKQGELSQIPAFRIVNIVGKSYRELGFWSPKFSFSENLDGHESGEKGGSSNGTAQVLGTVYWPGSSQSVPVGWAMINFSNSEENPLRIGVPARGAFNQFVKVSYDSRNRTDITGFSVHVFEVAVKLLPYQLSYELVPFYGSYDEMVEEIYHKLTDAINSFMEKTFDAAVGDTVIMADRCRYGEFSQPYVEAGLVMVVPTKRSLERWMFMKPFTKGMWVLTVATSVFTGFVVWLIERKDNPEFQGPFTYQIGTLLWFSITMLFSGSRESPRNNLSRFVVAMWFFVVLILTATFTASLTSMMTLSRLEPSVLDIGLLKRTDAVVGCDGNSFIVFSKGSPLAFDISEAILKATESGEIEKLENNMLSSSNCSTSQTDNQENQSLGPGPFLFLFALSGGVSAFAMFITVAQQLKQDWQIMSYKQALNLLARNTMKVSKRPLPPRSPLPPRTSSGSLPEPLPPRSSQLLQVLLHQSKAIANEGRDDQFVGTIGGLVDYSSRVGKEEKTAMQMAAKDFYRSTGSQLLLHLRDSYGDSAPAISTG